MLYLQRCEYFVDIRGQEPSQRQACRSGNFVANSSNIYQRKPQRPRNGVLGSAHDYVDARSRGSRVGKPLHNARTRFREHAIENIPSQHEVVPAIEPGQMQAAVRVLRPRRLAQHVGEMNPAREAAVHAQGLITRRTQVEHCVSAILGNSLKERGNARRGPLERLGMRRR